MPHYLDRTVQEVMAWARGQITDPDRSYDGLCQSFCRTAYGVDAWADSAIHAWQGIPRQHKHLGGSLGDAPRGALMYFDIGTHGHVAIAAGIKRHNLCLSNDFVRQGRIDYTPRSFRTAHHSWGVTYLGWSAWTAHGELRLT